MNRGEFEMGTDIKPGGAGRPRTLAEKVWDDHVVVAGAR